MTRGVVLRTVLGTLLLTVVVGCGSSESEPEHSGDRPASVVASPTAGRVESAGRAAGALIAALNRGDRSAATAAFAPTARFDSDGRVFRGRSRIFADFLGPDVLDAGGRYTTLSTSQQSGRTVVEYEFRTRGGGREHFTYAYRVRNGLITDVVGRTT